MLSSLDFNAETKMSIQEIAHDLIAMCKCIRFKIDMTVKASGEWRAPQPGRGRPVHDCGRQDREERFFYAG